MDRDKFFRCKHCGQLFPDDKCFYDEVNGYQCPNGCKESFRQPPYESPFVHEDTLPSKTV
jgi:hypothetical protein